MDSHTPYQSLTEGTLWLSHFTPFKSIWDLFGRFSPINPSNQGDSDSFSIVLRPLGLVLILTLSIPNHPYSWVDLLHSKSNFKGLTKHAPYQSLSNLFEKLHEGITHPINPYPIPNRGDSVSLQSIWSLSDWIDSMEHPTRFIHTPYQSLSILFETLHEGITHFLQSKTHSFTLKHLNRSTRITSTHPLSIPNHLHSGCLTSHPSNQYEVSWIEFVHPLSIPNHIHSKMIQGVHAFPFNQVRPFKTLHEGISWPSN